MIEWHMPMNKDRHCKSKIDGYYIMYCFNKRATIVNCV